MCQSYAKNKAPTTAKAPNKTDPRAPPAGAAAASVVGDGVTVIVLTEAGVVPGVFVAEGVAEALAEVEEAEAKVRTAEGVEVLEVTSWTLTLEAAGTEVGGVPMVVEGVAPQYCTQGSVEYDTLHICSQVFT